jgi:DUF438 domain-containing protein
MSEFINNTENRIHDLLLFVKGLINKEKGSELIKKYADAIDNVKPYDVIALVDKLMKEGIDIEDIKTGINKALNMLYKGLISLKIPDYNKIPFLDALVKENNELNNRLIEMRPLIKAFNSKNIDEEEREEILHEISDRVFELTHFETHYIKKENILFPYIEKYLKEYGCLPLMWAYHDDIRKHIKNTIEIIENGNTDLKKLNRLLGDLFFTMYAIKFREEYILFPVIFDIIPESEWDEMMRQAIKEGFAFIEPPEMTTISKEKEIEEQKHKNETIISDPNIIIDMGTGLLKLEQAVMMLNHLPVDMTFVDENDEVRYFSTPGHRIFPRSKAIIGRLVENCHPPSSVHIVKELVDSFKSGEKDKESFWIQMGPRFILIQYFAVRDEKGNYKGTLEVSQDISEIRKLEGEKRLMD